MSFIDKLKEWWNEPSFEDEICERWNRTMVAYVQDIKKTKKSKTREIKFLLKLNIEVAKVFFSIPIGTLLKLVIESDTSNKVTCSGNTAILSALSLTL